jgi:putative tricarboxylic transport membrane protein
MTPFWLRATLATVEYAVCAVLLALGVVLFMEAFRLGPGWGEQGPQPGFAIFVLTTMMVVGAIGVAITNYFKPDRRPFFEVSQEVVDLLKVGVPVVVVIYLIPWLGIYLTAGLYMGFFMAWYGRFRWYSAIAGLVAFPLVLWIILSKGFGLPLPMSVFYRQGILPI